MYGRVDRIFDPTMWYSNASTKKHRTMIYSTTVLLRLCQRF